MKLIPFFILPLIIMANVPVAAQAQKSKKELRKERREERNEAWRHSVEQGKKKRKHAKEMRKLTREMRYDRYHFNIANSTSLDSMSFSDGNISIIFNIDEGISFVLKNKLDTTISVIWDEASIIMPDGISEKIIHTGIKFIKRGETMTNTLIPPKAKIDDRAVPIDNVEWGDYSGTWEITPMFGNSGAEKLANDNQTFSLFLPIELPSGKKNYKFEFKIKVYNGFENRNR